MTLTLLTTTTTHIFAYSITTCTPMEARNALGNLSVVLSLRRLSNNSNITCNLVIRINK